MSAFKNIPSLIGGTAVVAAATIGLTAGPAPASAAPRPSGATIYVVPDPANSANYRVTIKGVFPMSEYDAVGSSTTSTPASLRVTCPGAH